MILPRKFSLAADDDYEHVAAAGGRLRALLEAFSEGSLPENYGLEQLSVYSESLLMFQRKDGSFSSYEYPEKLDADTGADAHRFVTWAAAAFLCLFQDSVEISREQGPSGLDEGILAVLNCPRTGDFSFPESGAAEPVQQVEAVLILSSGKIPGRLKRRPCPAPALLSALDELKEDFRHRLDTGNTMLAGGIEYAPLFRRAFRALQG